jgi:hypothetical protein
MVMTRVVDAEMLSVVAVMHTSEQQRTENTDHNT